MIYKGKSVEVVSESGLFTLVHFTGEPEHRAFNVLTKDLLAGQYVCNGSRKTDAVLAVMAKGAWLSLDEISHQSGYESLTGLSAAIRAFRKSEMGAHVVTKRKRNDGVFEYRLEA